MKYGSDEARTFLEGFSSKSYVDIFNIRSRVEQQDWERKAITNVREIVFQGTNPFPETKNVLYFHIPFCVTRCTYCPYYSEKYDPGVLKDYLAVLRREIDALARTPYLSSTHFGSIYFGGGTPSVLPGPVVEDLLDHVTNAFALKDDAEISFEANPATLTRQKIDALRRAGFNRVSLGIQSFRDELLQRMGCAHTEASARATISYLLDKGFRVNLDCIYGQPYQTLDDIRHDTAAIAAIGALGAPLQVTYFPLRIAEGTPLHAELLLAGGVTLGDHQRRLLDFDAHVEGWLRQAGFIREECPVFYHAAGGSEHLYHSTETRVVGFGSSAGTLLDGAESSNLPNVREYISAMEQGLDTALSGIVLNKRQAHERFVLYRVLYMNRTLPDFEDIVRERFQNYYHEPLGDLYHKVLDDMERLRFIQRKGNHIVLTDRCWRILNRVKIGMPSIL